MTPAQHDSLSKIGEHNNERVIVNILVTKSKTNLEILPVIPAGSKMVFPDDLTPLRKVVLQDAKILVDTQ